ncbi:MAG: lipopolysaccharide kinase InaA family protein [Planctomycetota bacterium]
MPENSQQIGPFSGELAARWRDPKLVDALASLREHMAGDGLGLGLRSTVLRVELPHADTTIVAALKSFPAQGRLRSRLAKRTGSKAERSYRVASALFSNGIGTPEPIAYLERWEGPRLAESFYICLWCDGLSSLREELIHLYHDEPYHDKIGALLKTVAEAVRPMHDAGIKHGDMGNQNILLRRTGPMEWAGVQFIDLNRGRVRGQPLRLRDRAFDLSRLTLPAHIRRLFREFYVGVGQPTRDLYRKEKRFVLRFLLHSKTRAWRHPFRERRIKKELAASGERGYPAPRDYWIWDPRGSQPIGALGVKERWLHRSPIGTMIELLATVLWLVPAWIGYRLARRRAYVPKTNSKPVEQFVGMTLHPRADRAQRERDLLRRLGKIPVLLRFCHHEKEEQWVFTADLARELHADGHSIAAAMVQDRRAINDPEAWDRFVSFVFERVGDILEWAEVGHCVNRVKWGIWSLSEYRRLAKPFAEIRRRYPNVRLMGPAVNDFEYHYLAATLSMLPRGVKFDALSLHLYVDRRGAPENTQFGLDSVDKFAMARGMARLAPGCADTVIISEVNWWLSSVGFVDWVTEDDYADFMLRYFVMAIASGMIHRVYWWRLAAADFGLVDDGGLVDDVPDGGEWRARPAFHMLEAFLEHFRDAIYLERRELSDRAFLYRFQKPGGAEVAFAYALEECEVSLPIDYDRVLDAFGKPLVLGDKPTLAGRPIYLLKNPA